jgi:TolB protein
MKKSTIFVRVGISIVVVLLVFAAVFLASRFAQPPSIPTGTPNRELTLTSNRDGNWDIYALGADGTLRNLSNDPGGDYFTSWSFDSQQVNFLSTRTGEMGPAQVKPDGSDLRTLTLLSAVTTLFFEGRLDWDAQWSPDGSRLGWASVRDLNLEIYAMDADGENVTRLTDDPGRDWFPAWSPDGAHMLFNSDRDGNENLYVMDADGANLRQLTDEPADDIRGVWSLDGARILFVSERQRELTNGALDLYVMNADGTDQAPLEGVFEGGWMRSPDGSQYAYVSNREGRWHIYVTDGQCDLTAVGCVRRVTDGDADHLFPAWRPS